MKMEPLVKLPASLASLPASVHVGRQVLLEEGASVLAMAERLGPEFDRAVSLIERCRGRVVVAGIGKSGQIAHKLAATLNCAGAPSLFLHPAEAAHGDLGAVTRGDVAVLISNSGETREVNDLIPYLGELDVPMIAIVGSLASTLARRVDVALDAGVEVEACPLRVLPTSSAVAALAMGDALAVALMVSRCTDLADIARVHPGGAIGLRRLRRVRDVVSLESAPLVRVGRPIGEALLAMARARRGFVVVVDAERRPLGLVSHVGLEREPHLDSIWLLSEVSSFMGASFATVAEYAPLSDAEARLAAGDLAALVVLDGEGRVCGVLERGDAS